jgi:hypothetical protein
MACAAQVVVSPQGDVAVLSYHTTTDSPLSFAATSTARELLSAADTYSQLHPFPNPDDTWKIVTSCRAAVPLSSVWVLTGFIVPLAAY